MPSAPHGFPQICSTSSAKSVSCSIQFLSGFPGSNHGSSETTALSSWSASVRGDEYASSTVSPSAVRSLNGTCSRVDCLVLTRATSRSVMSRRRDPTPRVRT